MTLCAARRDNLAQLLADDREADRVLLTTDDVAERRRQILRVLEFRRFVFARATVEAHRFADVKDERAEQVRFVLEQPRVGAARAGEDFPIETPQVFAGYIFAVVGKLSRAALLL